MISILLEEIYIFGRICLYFLGEAELFFGIWGAKENVVYGAEEIIFRDLERSVQFFSGMKGA